MRSNSPRRSNAGFGRWPHKWLRRLKLPKLFKLDYFKLSPEALSTAAGKQLALLYMLGLFSEPVPREVFDALTSRRPLFRASPMACWRRKCAQRNGTRPSRGCASRG